MPFISIEENRESKERARETARSAVAALSNASVPMRQASIFLDRWVQLNFRGEGEKVGGWTPFKYGGRLTTKAKADAKVDGRWVNTSAKLLQDTGHLRISFVPFATQTTAGIGSDLPYSKGHEEGTSKLPQRRMLPKAPEVQDDCRAIIESWLVQTLRDHS